MTFQPYLTAPSKTDKCWIHCTDGGYNYCIEISGGSCLPNCVGYVWGEWRKRLGQSPKLSKGNANTFWSYNDGYKRTQYPRLGSIICWDDGVYGHVGTVQKYDQPTGRITVAQSAYGGLRFYLTDVDPPYNYGKYKLQGFIHLPGSEPLPKAGTKEESVKTYKVICKTGNIRKTASSSSAKVGTIKQGEQFTSSKQSGRWAYYDAKKGWVCIEYGSNHYLQEVKPAAKKTTKNIDKLFQACKDEAAWELKSTYKWQSKPSTAKSKTYATCVTYVACVLQRYGALKTGQYIWHNGRGYGTGKVTGTITSDMQIIYCGNKRPASLKSTLKKGDIVMHDDNGSGVQGSGGHIEIYAGSINSDGKAKYFSGGLGSGHNTSTAYWNKRKILAIVRLKSVQ